MSPRILLDLRDFTRRLPPVRSMKLIILGFLAPPSGQRSWPKAPVRSTELVIRGLLILLTAPGAPKNPQIRQIIFSAMNITNGWWWSYAACSLWRAGYLPDGKPSDHVLQGRVPPAHQLRDGVD